jgi:exonuclease SbcC
VQVENEISVIQSNCSRYEADLEKAQNDVKRFENQKSSAKGIIEASQNLTENPEEKLKEAEQKSEQLQKTLDQNETDQKDDAVALEIYGACIKEAKKAIKALPALEKEYSLWSELYKTFSGNSTSKITLETYIQARFFDSVLEKANEQLNIMSDGQYVLLRSEDKNGNKKTGLELSVIDTWNDSKRPVASLSGGESFLASLSLALGMSEEIRMRAGGVHMETLFIDEGFGSLDEECLERAVRALQSVAEYRMVGIVSHVQSLIDQIPARIQVSKKNATEGSRTEIITEL